MRLAWLGCWHEEARATTAPYAHKLTNVVSCQLIPMHRLVGAGVKQLLVVKLALVPSLVQAAGVHGRVGMIKTVMTQARGPRKKPKVVCLWFSIGFH